MWTALRTAGIAILGVAAMTHFLGERLRVRDLAQPTEPDTPRVVSLAPSITEIVFALNAGDSLVGRTDFCLWPPEATAIPTVGSLGSPSVETVLAMRPDWTLASPLTRGPAIEQLRRVGLPVQELPFEGLEGIFRAFEQIGALVDRPLEAEQWIARNRTVSAPAADSTSPPASGLILLGAVGLYGAGPGSFPSDALEAVGLRNAADPLNTPWPKLNVEAVLNWDPDWIFIAADTPSPSTDEWLQLSSWGQEHPQFSRLSAVRHQRVYTAHNSSLTIPGPRFIELIRAIHTLISNEALIVRE